MSEIEIWIQHQNFLGSGRAVIEAAAMGRGIRVFESELFDTFEHQTSWN